MMVERRSNSCK